MYSDLAREKAAAVAKKQKQINNGLQVDSKYVCTGVVLRFHFRCRVSLLGHRICLIFTLFSSFFVFLPRMVIMMLIAFSSHSAGIIANWAHVSACLPVCSCVRASVAYVYLSMCVRFVRCIREWFEIFLCVFLVLENNFDGRTYIVHLLFYFCFSSPFHFHLLRSLENT